MSRYCSAHKSWILYQCRLQASRAVPQLLEDILQHKDRTAAKRVQSLMESLETQTGEGDDFHRYYLGQFNQSLFEPQNIDQAVNWYCKAATTAGEFQEAAHKQLASLGKSCDK